MVNKSYFPSFIFRCMFAPLSRPDKPVELLKIYFKSLVKKLRAIPDKNQKILNGAGHSWSQIFMKLSEHVKVVTLSKYLTLFFSQHARLPWQPDTKILAFRSAK